MVLLPFRKNEKELTALITTKKGSLIPYEQPLLIGEVRTFTTRAEIKEHLPDICGKALARAWYDDHYYNRLKNDVHQTFEDGGIILPSEYQLVFEHNSNTRASITIFEKTANTRFKIRVCSLSLTMIAKR